MVGRIVRQGDHLEKALLILQLTADNVPTPDVVLRKLADWHIFT